MKEELKEKRNWRQTQRFRVIGKILFVLYILFLIYFLIFSEWYGRTKAVDGYRYNLELFKEIRRFIQYRDLLGGFAVFTNVCGNVLIFVPYGFFISMAGTSHRFRKTFLYSFGLSLGVELFQMLTMVGSFDVDDILLNTTGGLLGWLLFLLCNKIRRKHYVQKSEKGGGKAC